MDNHQTVTVWDIFVRTFHWTLAILVGIAFLTGDDDSLLHTYTGYTIILLIAMRLIWGLIGSEHARLVNFIGSPVEALDYLKGMLRGTSRRYLGHNPAAAWMIIFLVVLLLLVNATGCLAQPTNVVRQQESLPTAPCLLSIQPGLITMTLIMIETVKNLQGVNSGKRCTKSPPVFY